MLTIGETKKILKLTSSNIEVTKKEDNLKER